MPTHAHTLWRRSADTERSTTSALRRSGSGVKARKVRYPRPRLLQDFPTQTRGVAGSLAVHQKSISMTICTHR